MHLVFETTLVVPLATSNALYRLQSISYVPAYNDGKALVEFTSSAADSFVVMDFELAPEDVAAEIAEDWENLLSMKAVNVATRAAELIDMPILSCEADDQGIITVKASGENLGDDFFTGHQYMNARLEIADDSFNHKSEYVPMVTVNHVSTDEPIIPVTPTIKNNQIIYTSTDENVVTPNNNYFGATITSNVYANGKGIITFDKDLTTIPNNAFKNKSTLKSVILPNFVTEIGQYAFVECIALEEVTIGDDTLTIGYGAFSDCIELASVKLGEKLETIESYAFSGCTHLTSINFPDRLKYIYSSAFANCDALTEISLPESLKSIGGNAFADCDKLKTVNMSEGLETISNDAFKNCTKITSITIPNSVTGIGQYAFVECIALEEVTIGDGTMSLGYGIFSDCVKLATINCKPTTPPSLGGYAFSGIVSGYKIYVPKNSLSAYQTSWSSYKDHIVAGSF